MVKCSFHRWSCKIDLGLVFRAITGRFMDEALGTNRARIYEDNHDDDDDDDDDDQMISDQIQECCLQLTYTVPL